MFVDENNCCSISKQEFLDSFAKLYKAIEDYQQLLTEFSNRENLDTGRLQAMLQEQVNHTQFDGLNTRAMGMVGSYLRSTLEMYKGDKLKFRLPSEPEDDFFPVDDSYAQLANDIETVEKELEQIQARIFYITRLLPPKNIEKLRLILKGIAGLFKAIVRKDFDDIEVNLNHIHHLTANKESFFLINEIGRMVRGIHNSLQDFSETVPTDTLDPSLMEDMPDAIDKLNLVIQRMETAANSTLDHTDVLLDNNSAAIEKNQQMLTVCESVEEKLSAIKQSHPDLEAQINDVMSEVHNDIKEELIVREKVLQESESIYFEIIGNQSFQDLTGQTLKKIITFIEQLEFSLLSILQKYSGNMESPKPAAPTPSQQGATEDHVSPLQGQERDGLMLAGPQDNDTQDMKKQADIDKMLAGFGF